MFAQILLRTVLTTKGLLDLGGFKTRKQAQKPAHKAPSLNAKDRPFRLGAAYAPVSKRACLRSELFS